MGAIVKDGIDTAHCCARGEDATAKLARDEDDEREKVCENRTNNKNALPSPLSTVHEGISTHSTGVAPTYLLSVNRLEILLFKANRN